MVLCLFVAAALGAAGSDSAPSPVVATIGDYTITRGELEQRLLQEIRPHEEEFYREPEPVTAESVLRKMLAEKATSMEGRRLGYLQDEQIHTAIMQFEQQQLVRRLLEAQLEAQPEGKLSVDEAEIERVMKDNPQATREQARTYLQRARAMQLMEQFYNQVVEKRGLRKVGENFARTAEIHQRLLTQPLQPRGPNEYWIRNSQMSTDLSEEEKNLVLATFEGGQFTLKDWFATLCNIVPPRRPGDLGTPEGVEKLLDMALRGPVLAVEARARGFDKDPKLRSDVRRLEDQRLLYKSQEAATREVKEPTIEQAKEYFDKDPQRFAAGAALKVDQIWCRDEQTARKVKAMLDEGADFEAVKKEHSLQKDAGSHSVAPGGEGPFWADLWKGEPNQVIGPVRGFYGSGATWRIVKVLEKTPARTQPYSEQLGNSIKWAIFSEQRQRVLKAYEKELLEKYPHEVFGDRIEDLDPLEIALKQQDK